MKHIFIIMFQLPHLVSDAYTVVVTRKIKLKKIQILFCLESGSSLTSGIWPQGMLIQQCPINIIVESWHCHKIQKAVTVAEKIPINLGEYCLSFLVGYFSLDYINSNPFIWVYSNYWLNRELCLPGSGILVGIAAGLCIYARLFGSGRYCSWARLPRLFWSIIGWTMRLLALINLQEIIKHIH